VAFAGVAVLGALALIAVLVLLPRLRPTSALNLSELPRLFRIGYLRIALLMTAVVVNGHFAAYTYIAPYLEQEAGIPSQWVSSLLLLYGTASVVGNFVDGADASRALRGTLLAVICTASLSMLDLLVIGEAPFGAVGVLVVWGFAFPALPLCLQTLALHSARHAPEAATSCPSVRSTSRSLVAPGGRIRRRPRRSGVRDGDRRGSRPGGGGVARALLLTRRAALTGWMPISSVLAVFRGVSAWHM
jgi:predicted MFS family arabinose efflux permease